MSTIFLSQLCLSVVLVRGCWNPWLFFSSWFGLPIMFDKALFLGESKHDITCFILTSSILSLQKIQTLKQTHINVYTTYIASISCQVVLALIVAPLSIPPFFFPFSTLSFSTLTPSHCQEVMLQDDLFMYISAQSLLVRGSSQKTMKSSESLR